MIKGAKTMDAKAIPSITTELTTLEIKQQKVKQICFCLLRNHTRLC